MLYPLSYGRVWVRLSLTELEQTARMLYCSLHTTAPRFGDFAANWRMTSGRTNSPACNWENMALLAPPTAPFRIVAVCLQNTGLPGLLDRFGARRFHRQIRTWSLRVFSLPGCVAS